MRMLILFVATSLVVVSCVNRDFREFSDTDQAQLDMFMSLDSISILTIASEDEIGTPLFLAIELLDKETLTPLQNLEVLFYHTNSSGDYQPQYGNDERTARLSGRATTDSLGRIFVRTILPGGYGSAEGSGGHIHTEIDAARPKNYDIQFLQYSGFMALQFVNSSDQHFFADLRKLSDQRYYSDVQILCKGITHD